MINMTGRTITIHGSDEVMAMFGQPGTFYRGKWQNVRITKTGLDEETPIEVRNSLVGMIIPTIFSKEQIEKQTGATFPIPKESMLAYCLDVIEILKSAGKTNEAEQLRKVAPSPLDMYIIEKEIYEAVN